LIKLMAIVSLVFCKNFSAWYDVNVS
jgi:hypothetical protein